MNAWVLAACPGAYAFQPIPAPELGADEVRIRPVASALNHLDLWLTAGLPSPPLPHVPGCDVAGVVEEIGPEVSDLAVGDEVVVNPAISSPAVIAEYGIDAPFGPGLQVVGENRWGGHAEQVVVPARNAVLRPAGRSWEECAALPVAMLTAWRMLRRARLEAGERVLVVGIGGGVSSAAALLAQHLGAEVFVTSRTAAKRKQALRLGVAGAFPSDEPLPLRVDVVVDSIGPDTWKRSLAALRPGGRMVVCGGTSGSTVPLDIPQLFFKQYEIIGSTLGSIPEFAEVIALAEEGLPMVIDEVFSLDRYPDALERLRRGEQLGKIVLRHGG
jgi:NADPH:quinone reductase-like Zn-dependent oxidoreductase